MMIAGTPWSDLLVGIFTLAAVYLLVRPGSDAALAVRSAFDAVTNLVLLVTGPAPY